MNQRFASLVVLAGMGGAFLLGACGGATDEAGVRESCIDGFLSYADETGLDSSDGSARVAIQLAEPEEWAEVCWVTIRADADECTFFERRRTQQTSDAGFSCATGSPTIAHWTDFSLDATP